METQTKRKGLINLMATVIESTASFTRPNDTTAYAANDLVANSTTAGSVTPMTFQIPTGSGRDIQIKGVKIQKSGTTATNGNFNLRLYASSPTCANGDNGAWSTSLSGYLGKLDAAIVEAFTDGCAVVNTLAEGADVHFRISTDHAIYGLLVADAAYTPAANEVFTVTLYCEAE